MEDDVFSGTVTHFSHSSISHDMTFLYEVNNIILVLAYVWGSGDDSQVSMKYVSYKIIA